jgi:hypothetical protein
MKNFKTNYMQLYTHFFQYNIPAENHAQGKTDDYINVIATWHTNNTFSDGTPMVATSPVNLSFYDCIKVKNWNAVTRDIDKIAESHFVHIAKEHRLAEARAVLLVEQNPIIARFQIAEA